MLNKLSGNSIAVINFVFWGLLPLYYQFVVVNDIFEILAVRIIASIPTLALFFWLMRKPWPSLQFFLAHKKDIFICAIATSLITISWCTFTYGLTHNKVLQCSLGFFIAPLFAMAFGIILHKEQTDWLKKVAILLAFFGVGYQIYIYQKIPLLSLVMAISFALYALCKKHCQFDLFLSVTVENLILAPFAILYLGYLLAHHQGLFLFSDASTFWLYLGSAPMTIVPYLLYTLAINRTSLTMIGLLHYIEPSIQFILALWVFHEPFDKVKFISFSFIWAGLLLVTIPKIIKLIKIRLAENNKKDSTTST